MSIPPPPQHPPPRRQPRAEEDPSLTTQIFLDQAKAATGGASASQPPGTAAASAPTGSAAEAANTRPEPAAPLDDASAQESTQMMSMEELRALAASSHIDAIDGPREQEDGGSAAAWAMPQGDARAQTTAPPGVFTPAMRQAASHPSPDASVHGPGVPPPPPVPPPHAAQPAPYGAGQAGHAANHAPYAAQQQPWPDQGSAAAGYAAAHPAPATKRGMPVLAIIFVVLSALIVLGIGGWILVDALGRSDDQSQEAVPPPPATSTEEPGGLVDDAYDSTAEPAEDVQTFVTPSGNIGCTIDAERARCSIKTFNYDPPDPPDGCTMDEWGSIVVANGEGAGFSCTPAEFPTDGQTLDYGETVSAHGMTCESTESGVICRSDETDASFSIARASADFTQK